MHIEYVRDFYDRKMLLALHLNRPMHTYSVAVKMQQTKEENNYHFSWMIDYVEEDHGFQMIQQNFTAEQPGKRSCFHAETFCLLLSFHN